MNNRGQFFLIAALIVIVVIFSVATVYNSISSKRSDIDYTQGLANDIKRESFNIINNGFFNNLPLDSITQNLDNLSLIYSKSNPSFNITYLSYYSGVSKAYMFSGNIKTDISSRVSLSSNNITLSLNNIDHTFNLTKGYNLFVVVQKENENEKYIATA